MASTVFADRLSREGIIVFEVRPGVIQTDMTAKIKDKYDKLISEGLVPQKRWGLPEDIGKAVASICQGRLEFFNRNGIRNQRRTEYPQTLNILLYCHLQYLLVNIF